MKRNTLTLVILTVVIAVFLIGGGNDLIKGATTAEVDQPVFSLSMDSDPTTSMEEVLRYQGTYVNRYGGRQNGAWKFSGRSDYVMTSSTDLKDLEEFTIMFWFKPSDLSNRKRAHMLWQGDLNEERAGQYAGNGWGSEQELHLSLGDEIGLNRYEDHKLTFYFGDETNHLKISTPIKYTDWQHVAVTVRNTEAGALAKLYFEGSLVGKDFTNDQINREGWGESTSLLGKAGKDGPAGDWNRYFEGMLDELAIYDRILTSDEISQICWKQNDGVTC